MKDNKKIDKWNMLMNNVSEIYSNNNYNNYYNYIIHDIEDNNSDKCFEDILFPISMKMSALTIAQDLVSVQPLSGITEKLKNKIFIENREMVVDSVINDTEYVEKLLEDDMEYIKLMKDLSINGNLFYMDYVYNPIEDDDDDEDDIDIDDAN